MYEYICKNIETDEQWKFRFMPEIERNFGISLSTIRYHFSIMKREKVVIGEIFIKKVKR